MALAHADSFMSYSWDPDQHMTAFCRWWEQGSYLASPGFRHWLYYPTGLVAISGWYPALLAGGRCEWDNGNGSIMRAIPQLAGGER